MFTNIKLARFPVENCHVHEHEKRPTLMFMNMPVFFMNMNDHVREHDPRVSGQTIDPRATMFPAQTAGISTTPHRDQKAQDLIWLQVFTHR